MASESREWSVPAPVRTLLWWPAISFVLAVVAPGAAIGAIIVAGAALALLGGLIAAAAKRLRRPRRGFPGGVHDRDAPRHADDGDPADRARPPPGRLNPLAPPVTALGLWPTSRCPDLMLSYVR